MSIKNASSIAAFVLAGCISTGALAQIPSTDIILLKAGYTPLSTVNFSEKNGLTPEKISQPGFLLQGEYNLNVEVLWLGFGLEYQRLYATQKRSGGITNTFTNQYVHPMVTVKFSPFGGLYAGVGLSGKYLLSTTKIDAGTGTYHKDLDLWTNAVAGWNLPIGEEVVINVEGRIGYNITNHQFEKETFNGETSSVLYTTDSQYDFAFYAGIGHRISVLN